MRLVCPPVSSLVTSVSIHASVKDATLECEEFARRVRVSIHASVKDATLSVAPSKNINPSFNPRICKRCD